MNPVESYPSPAAAVKARVRATFFLFGIGLGLCHAGEAALPRGREVMLPMTCSELFPETEPFAHFFEAVARGAVTTNARLSKRMFRVLALRQKLADSGKLHKDDNPIDTILRKTGCFFRETKDPARPVPFDDAQFLKYIETSIDEVENKSEAAVYEAELARLQREEYEKRLEANQGLIDQLRQEADRAAQKSYDQLSQKARKKVQSP
jgi:hypothetical protein